MCRHTTPYGHLSCQTTVTLLPVAHSSEVLVHRWPALQNLYIMQEASNADVNSHYAMTVGIRITHTCVGMHGHNIMISIACNIDTRGASFHPRHSDPPHSLASLKTGFLLLLLCRFSINHMPMNLWYMPEA